MTVKDRELPRNWLWTGTAWRKSIFPVFDFDVPMPKDTPIPPRMVLLPDDPEVTESEPHGGGQK